MVDYAKIEVPQSCTALVDARGVTREAAVNAGGCAAAAYCTYYKIPPAACESIGRAVMSLVADAWDFAKSIVGDINTGSGSFGDHIIAYLFEMSKRGGLNIPGPEFEKWLASQGLVRIRYSERLSSGSLRFLDNFFIDGRSAGMGEWRARGVAVVTAAIAAKKVSLSVAPVSLRFGIQLEQEPTGIAGVLATFREAIRAIGALFR